MLNGSLRIDAYNKRSPSASAVRVLSFPSPPPFAPSSFHRFRRLRRSPTAVLAHPPPPTTPHHPSTPPLLSPTATSTTHTTSRRRFLFCAVPVRHRSSHNPTRRQNYYQRHRLCVGTILSAGTTGLRSCACVRSFTTIAITIIIVIYYYYYYYHYSYCY